jgi:hypothetical protein
MTSEYGHNAWERVIVLGYFEGRKVDGNTSGHSSTFNAGRVYFVYFVSVPRKIGPGFQTFCAQTFLPNHLSEYFRHAIS